MMAPVAFTNPMDKYVKRRADAGLSASPNPGFQPANPAIGAYVNRSTVPPGGGGYQPGGYTPGSGIPRIGSGPTAPIPDRNTGNMPTPPNLTNGGQPMPAKPQNPLNPTPDPYGITMRANPTPGMTPTMPPSQSASVNDYTVRQTQPSATPIAETTNAADATTTPPVTMRNNPTPSMVEEPPTTQPQDPNASDGQQNTALTDPGALTDAGKNAEADIARRSENLGKDPGFITEGGKIEADRNLKYLQGGVENDPLIKNAQNKADTAASMRQYQNDRAVKEMMAQTHFTPGTAQYNRALSKAQASVNAGNQEGQNAVNAYTRQRTADVEGRAKEIETQQYNRDRTNLSDATGLEDTGRARAVGERNYTDAKALETVNQLEGPPKLKAIQMKANGASPADIMKEILGPDGKIKPMYMGKTSGQNTAEGNIDEIRTTYKPGTTFQENGKDVTVPQDDPKTPQNEYEDWVQSRAATQSAATYQAKNQPVIETNDKTEVDRIKKSINSGSLDPNDFEKARENNLIPSYEPTTIPMGVGKGAKDLIGKSISLSGEQYKVVANGQVSAGQNDSNNDYIVVEKADGTIWYNSRMGGLSQTPPQSSRGPDKGKYAVYNPKTKKMEYSKATAIY